MKILEKLEEKFSGVELKKSELGEKFFEENKIFFETERALNTNKNQEIISIGKKIKEKISNLFGDNEELQFEYKVSEFEEKFQENFSEYFNENGEILKENFSEENKAKNLELFRESKKIRSNIEGFNESAFLSEDDYEFKIINGIYNKLADFNVAFIDAYSNKKEEIESKNKREDSEKPVLGNNGNEEFESGKKSGETYGKINKLISEKEKFNKVKNRKKSIIDETLTFKKLNKSEVEDFGIDIKKEPGAFNIMKNTKSAVGKLILAGSLVFGGYSGLNNIKNSNTESSGNDQNKTSKVINNNELNSSVDLNQTIEIKNPFSSLLKNLNEKFEPYPNKTWKITKDGKLTIPLLSSGGTTDLKDINLTGIKNITINSGNNFVFPNLDQNITKIFTRKHGKITIGGKNVNINGDGTWKEKKVVKVIKKESTHFSELEKKFNTSYGKFIKPDGTLNQEVFNEEYKKLKIRNTVNFFKKYLEEYVKNDKLQTKSKLILNALDKKIEAEKIIKIDNKEKEKPEIEFHNIW